AFLWLILVQLQSVAAAQEAQEPIKIDVTAPEPVARFVPSEALGAGVDGHEEGDTENIYDADALAKITSIPFWRLSYRLRTELGVAAWHWNNEGTWSDPAHAQGYWVSSDKPKKPIEASFGYRLPRRGNTKDQANN